MRGTLIVFARQPLPGRVKTRLAAAVGAQAACDAYVELAGIALGAAARTRGVAVELCVDGDPDDTLVRAWAAAAGARIARQGRGDLGERMHRALCRAVAQGTPAVLIGTDCPGYRASLIEQAFDALVPDRAAAPSDAVFAPAEDGGYALVGVRRPQPALFGQMRWSSAHTMDDTRARCRAAGLRWHELPTLWDVDDAASLGRWRDGR